MTKNEKMGENELLFKLKLIDEINKRVEKYEGKLDSDKEFKTVNHI